ncbi:hypothetical protein MTX38_10925 [Rhodococcus sp. ARC_M13]|uniref:hypothetical protein n=1 Tax=unclassified Rhodococcus (in: high G+C Gram-positive bacteria) TaxID=192944 RepID=UPI0004C33E1F|nr:hypothetical protein [Rhodococcus sp. ARC_M13]MCJ0897575.1 hypothetical protein [Rhodococcus sp. ARC_M13]BBE47426.1 hypothetical protein RE2895_43570 [Rhodococcus erythropolis]
MSIAAACMPGWSLSLLNRPVVTVAPPGSGTALTAAAKAGSAIGTGLGHVAAAAALVAATVVALAVDVFVVFDELAEPPHATSRNAAGTKSAAKVRFM